MMESNNIYALITGASSGIGYQYARQLAQKGYSLIIVSNEDTALAEKAEILRNDFPVDVVPLVRNLGIPSAAKELFDYCQAQHYEVDVLINNAGVYHDRDFIADSVEFNELILNLHVNTPAMLCYYFSKEMVNRHKGYILNMSSITSNIVVQRLATYSATKAFLKNFSRALHIELYHKGVYVTTVRPGAVNTGLYNISNTATKIGMAIGYIVSPEKLARQGLRGLFHRRACVTPGIFNHILLFLVALLPTGLLRLIRRWKIF